MTRPGLMITLLCLATLLSICPSALAQPPRVTEPGTYRTCSNIDPETLHPWTETHPGECLATATNYEVWGDLTISREASDGYFVRYRGTFLQGGDDPQKPIWFQVEAHFSKDWAGILFGDSNAPCVLDLDFAHLERAILTGRVLTQEGRIATLNARVGEHGVLTDCRLVGDGQGPPPPR